VRQHPNSLLLLLKLFLLVLSADVAAALQDQQCTRPILVPRLQQLLRSRAAKATARPPLGSALPTGTTNNRTRGSTVPAAAAGEAAFTVAAAAAVSVGAAATPADSTSDATLAAATVQQSRRSNCTPTTC
jgi:hypothetical protein